MTQLVLSDELATTIASAAASRNLTPEALLTSLLSRLEHDEPFADAVLQQVEPELTERQLARMREGLAQLNRGQIVTKEQVDQFFVDWFEELDQRAATEA